MADSSEVRLSYIREVTPGTTPASAPQELRFTGESLKADTETVPNPEIRPGRQVQDEIRTRIEPSGDINTVLSAASHDDLFEGVMTGTWGADIGISAEITIGVDVTAGIYKFTDSGAGLGGIAVGSWFKVSGFTGNPTVNNGWFKRLPGGDASNVIVGDSTGTPIGATNLVTEPAGDSVSIVGSRLANGSDKHYYTLEKHLTDLTPDTVFSFQGCLLGGYNLTVEPNRIIEGGFTNIIGQTPTRQSATLGSGAIATVSTNKVMNAINGISMVREAAVSSTLELSRLNFSIDNALRGKPAIGVAGNADVSLGDFGVTLELVAYFDAVTGDAIYDKWLADTSTSLSYLAGDDVGNEIMHDWPEVKISSIEVLAGGKGQDMVLQMRARAIEDPVEGITMSMTKNY